VFVQYLEEYQAFVIIQQIFTEWMIDLNITLLLETKHEIVISHNEVLQLVLSILWTFLVYLYEHNIYDTFNFS
jgi:hypothetical protein